MIPVGHRALVATERADGRYDCHYAHWGADEWRLLATLADLDTPGDARDCPAVDPAPLATGVPFETVVDSHVDFQTFEAVYRVAAEAVTPYAVCWFGFPAANEHRPDSGALIAVDPADARADGALVRGWLAGTRGLLGALVAAAELDVAAARDWLVVRLRSWDGDREIVFGPGVDAGERDGP